MSLKRVLLSRGTVLTLIASLTVLMIVASIVPQAFMTPPARMFAWRVEHPVASRVAAALGLGRVYSHPVFAAVLLLALGCLVYSGADQFGAALRRFRGRGPTGGGTVVEVPASVEELARVLRSRGYLTVRRDADERVLVRHPWGYWGNFLLHAGLATVVAASAVIGLTQQRGTVHLVEGESFPSGGAWFVEENGLAARKLVLPFAVRLDHLELGFWPNHGLRTAISTLSLLRPGEPPTARKVGINEFQQLDGTTIYQGVELGHAFRIEVQEGDRVERFNLLIQLPATPEVAATNDFPSLLPRGELLRAKYLVDAERRSFQEFNPLLTLRVEGQDGVIGEATLRPGTSGVIGPYRIRLEKVSLWSRIFFARVTGIAGVFAGFFVIALGGILHYFTPPREAVLRATEAGVTRMTWRAARFPGFYVEELEEIRSAVTSGGTRV
jgi:cytochrome c biogenesis protein